MVIIFTGIKKVKCGIARAANEEIAIFVKQK